MTMPKGKEITFYEKKKIGTYLKNKKEGSLDCQKIIFFSFVL